MGGNRAADLRNDADPSIADQGMVSGIPHPAEISSSETSSSSHHHGSHGPSVAKWRDRSYRGDVMRWLHMDEARLAGQQGLVEALNLIYGLRPQLADMG